MKTSIFDMTFTLPPLIEMTQVEKDMPENTTARYTGPCHGLYCTAALTAFGEPHENIYL
jgi:hypothetical protein